MPLTYVKPERLNLRSHADYNEKWVQDRIGEDPTILGLGDVAVIERERSQGHPGRLDFLLSDPETNRRYEVELMLGPTDPSHIIRTIEYWDIERRRYPAYDHVAVLVAEDITSRFLNVLALFSGSIPFIAIQLSAFKVGDQISLTFLKVLDQTDLRVDDEEEAGDKAPADRAYWEQKAHKDVLGIADHMVEIIRSKAKAPYALNYTRRFIGLSDGTRSRNFVLFVPRQKHLAMLAVVADPGAWTTRFEEAGLDAGARRRRVRVSLTKGDLEANRAIFEELITEAVKHHEEE